MCERETLERDWVQHLTHTLRKCYHWATSLLFSKLIALKEFFSHTHIHAHSRMAHACMHAHTTEDASKSSEEGTGSPAGEDAQCACWECSLQDMCLYVLLSTGPSSAPTPTPPPRFLLRQALHQVSKLALKFWFSSLNLPCSHLFLTYGNIIYFCFSKSFISKQSWILSIVD